MISFCNTSLRLSNRFKVALPFSLDKLIARPTNIEKAIKAMILSFDRRFIKSFVLIVLTVLSKKFLLLLQILY